MNFYQMKRLCVRNFRILRICKVSQRNGQEHERLAARRTQVDRRRQEVKCWRKLESPKVVNDIIHKLRKNKI
jgi:hypothetical protein